LCNTHSVFVACSRFWRAGWPKKPSQWWGRTKC